MICPDARAIDHDVNDWRAVLFYVLLGVDIDDPEPVDLSDAFESTEYIRWRITECGHLEAVRSETGDVLASGCVLEAWLAPGLRSYATFAALSLEAHDALRAMAREEFDEQRDWIAYRAQLERWIITGR